MIKEMTLKEIINANGNVLLKWIPKFGPNKGKEVEEWFNADDTEVKRLMEECGATIVRGVIIK